MVAGAVLALGSASVFAETLHWDWLTSGEKSGQQVVEVDGNTRTIEFGFNDRGRGPEQTTVVVLNEAGIPVSVRTTGVNYQKAAVEETFEVEDGVARWASSIEERSMPFDNRFYLSESFAPEYSAILARAILADEDGEVALLPSGTAQLETVTTQAVTGADGETRNITLYALTGLDPMPQHLWLDENQELFGADFSWMAITPVGFNDTTRAMAQAQEAHTDAYIEARSKALSTKLDGLTAITGARLFNPADGSVREDVTVFLLDGMITAVFEGETVIPEDTRTIDGRGQFLMPALWDMHGHIRPGNYFGYLASGVTHVRDMANDPDYVLRTRRQIAAGKIAAPDIHPMGFIDRKNEFAAPTGRLATTLDEALGFVDEYARTGHLGIKLYSSIQPEWVAPIADHAHGLGLDVLGHIPSGMSAEDAIRAGFDEVTHINMAFLNFLGAREIDTRTPKRFTEVGERGGELDLEAEAFQNFVELMKSNDVALDPTMGVFMDMFDSVPGRESIVFVEVADHFPELLRRSLVDGRSYNHGQEAAYLKTGEKTEEMVRRLHESGVQLLPGTDSLHPGPALISELIMYADAGIPNAEVLRLATLDSARHLQMDQQFGSVEQGKRAHLILVAGNPLEDIRDLWKVRTVIKGGAMYDSGQIWEALGFTPFD